jgi:hypothetical protein
MKLKTYKRLEQLEQLTAKRARNPLSAAGGSSLAPMIQNMLSSIGFERRPQESLFESLSRLLGMTSAELRDRLSKGGSLRDVFQEQLKVGRDLYAD